MNRDVEDYVNWQKNQDSALNNLKKNINPLHLIGLIIVFLIAYKVLTDSGINKNFIFFGLIALVIFILWVSQKKGPRTPIPENVIKQITVEILKRKIPTEFAPGTQIVCLNYCHLVRTGVWGISWTFKEWEVGVKIIKPSGLRKDILVYLEPFEGFITRIRDMPTGYTGNESQDLKIVTPEAYSQEKTESKI